MAACAGSSVKAQRPDIIATNAFYYYADVDVAWEFYRDTLGFETVVDYGFAKIMRVASASYLTLVRACVRAKACIPLMSQRPSLSVLLPMN
jgi:hypothetical protein